MKIAEQPSAQAEKFAAKKHDLSLLKFATGHSLVVDKTNGELKLLNKNESLQLQITIKEDGIIVNVNATQLNLQATEQLNLSAKKINIAAEEHLNIQSGGNLVQQVKKDALNDVGGTNKMVATTQKITANLGNVEVKANDFVRLDGEKVLLNCD